MSELVLEIKNLSLSFDTQGASASILKNVELGLFIAGRFTALPC